MKIFIAILLGISLFSFNTFADATSAEKADAAPLAAADTTPDDDTDTDTDVVKKDDAGTDTTDTVVEEDTGPSVEKAEELYSQRGEDVEKARQAADMYKELAAQKTTEDKMAKAELVLKQVESMYYVANKLSKSEIFREGSQLADGMVQLLAEPESSEEEELKASALFWYGACLGQFMRLTKNLSYKGALEKAMYMVINDLQLEEVHEYGAHRVLGRMYAEIPFSFMGGDKPKAREYLGKAFDNTLVSDEVAVSIHGLNNLYYADILEHFKKKEQACQILQTFIEQDSETLMEERIPETAAEMEEAKRC